MTNIPLWGSGPRQPIIPHLDPGSASLSQAILDCFYATGISPSIVWVQLCAVISLLTKGLANVMWLNGQTTCLGGHGLLVAHATSGKSLIFRILTAAIEACAGDEFAEGRTLAEDLQIADASPSAIIAHLGKVPFAGIFTDEASALTALEGKSAILAKLLDGSLLRWMRRHETVHLQGHSFSMLLAMQAAPFTRSKLFSTAPGNDGLINRFFVATAPKASVEYHAVVLSPDVQVRHQARVYELLAAMAENLRNKTKDLPVLEMTAASKDFFLYSEQEIRREATAYDSPQSTFQEYAGRHGERTLKLAGSMHLYDNGPEALNSKIELSTLQAADRIGRLALDDYLQVTFKPPTLTTAEKDAQQIISHLRDHHLQYGTVYFDLRTLRKLAPNMGLTSARVSKALPVLIASNHGKIVMPNSGREALMFFPGAPPHLRYSMGRC